MTKAKDKTAPPEEQAERQELDQAVADVGEALAAEEAAQAVPTGVAPPSVLQGLIDEIEAAMHHALMPGLIEALKAGDHALRITEDGPLFTVALAGIENTSTQGGLIAMRAWCDAARRHLREAAAA